MHSKYRCLKCEHIWKQEDQSRPNCCPGCSSPRIRIRRQRLWRVPFDEFIGCFDFDAAWKDAEFVVKREFNIEPVRKTREQKAEDCINHVLKSLTYREREILKLRFGIGDGFTYTQSECGTIFKISRGYVSQIEPRAINKLRHPVRLAKLLPFLSWATRINESDGRARLARKINRSE
ncbi:MAG TPA: sigma factor-like helix-turn-helix DNA-binding protein [Phycisphaerae bacterium]|nr:sigma factor-like helix-turn-helix DNA-binding protein [Phycisphaerae bacterium]